MPVDYMELRQATEKITELEEIIKQLRIELSEARQIARDMVEVTQDDANNYSLILAALGLEEEGDPVAEVEMLKAFYDRAKAEKASQVQREA